MAPLSIDSEDSWGLFVCFHVHPSSPYLSRTIFSLTPFPIHVPMLATSSNDGLKQTPVLLSICVHSIGAVGFVGWRPMETFILYRVGEDCCEFESLVLESSLTEQTWNVT
jgi:hypothetical protein